MGKIIVAFNMTIDGYCDHTHGIATDELHQLYTDLLHRAGYLLYGRVTYQLMEYWKPFIQNPTGNPSMDDFALAIDKAPKLVFSRTLQNLDWNTARLATRPLPEEVEMLKHQSEQDIYVCSPSLIVALTEMNLVDEYQLCIHPVIAGSGLPLFKNISEKITLELTATQTLGMGIVVLNYKRAV